MPHAAAMPLADDLLTKTLGNPFFLLHYLRRLYDAELLRFDYEVGHWTYRRSEAESVGMAANAAQCMTAGLARFDARACSLLSRARCKWMT